MPRIYSSQRGVFLEGGRQKAIAVNNTSNSTSKSYSAHQHFGRSRHVTSMMDSALFLPKVLKSEGQRIGLNPLSPLALFKKKVLSEN